MRNEELWFYFNFCRRASLRTYAIRDEIIQNKPAPSAGLVTARAVCCVRMFVVELLRNALFSAQPSVSASGIPLALGWDRASPGGHRLVLR